jgi:hypothetical protein
MYQRRVRTFEFEAASGVYTELQCGSYIFMNADYGRNLDRDGAPTKGFVRTGAVTGAVPAVCAGILA